MSSPASLTTPTTTASAAPPLLSEQEANHLATILAIGDSEPLRTVATRFREIFVEEGVRTRALLALRSAVEVGHASGYASLPTTPDQISLLYLVYAAGVAEGGEAASRASSATLYHHLLRLEDALREDCYLAEIVRYKTTASVGAKKLTGRDAAARDAYRGHLLQKVFLLRCAAGKAPENFSATEFVAESGGVDTLEAEASTWSVESNRSSLSAAVGAWRAAAETEAAATASGAANTLGGFVSRAVPLPRTASRLAAAHDILKKPLTAVLSAPDAVLGPLLPPVAARPAPPLRGIAADARMLLPLAPAGAHSTLLFDAAPHAPEWREARTAVEVGRTGELSAAQAQKLIAAVGATTAAGGKPLLPYLGITPTVFAALCRHNPQRAAAVLQKVENAAAAEPLLSEVLAMPSETYKQQGTVLVAASRASLLSPSHLSTYVARAATIAAGWSSSTPATTATTSADNNTDAGSSGVPTSSGADHKGGAAAEKGDVLGFIKTFGVTLQQMCEQRGLQLAAADKSLVAKTIQPHAADVPDLVKIWSA